jgi:hypothetical protein
VGAVPYFLGLILMLSSSIKSIKIKSDPFLTVTFCLGFSFLAQLIMGSSHAGLTGMFLWGFLAISIAGQKYYNNSFKENSNF